MINAIPKRNFLLKNEYKDGKRVSVYAKKGEKIQITEEDAIKFWGGLQLSDKDKQALLKVAKSEKFKRVI